MNQPAVHPNKPIADVSSKPKTSTIANSLPNLPLKTIFAITFGFCGVNMAFSLQSSQMSRIFQTIGADPTKPDILHSAAIGWIIRPTTSR